MTDFLFYYLLNKTKESCGFRNRKTHYVEIISDNSFYEHGAARILMSKFVIGYIGADALFLSEPASWLGAMLCVFLPYFYYRKKLLR